MEKHKKIQLTTISELSSEFRLKKRAKRGISSIQYGYRKLGTHALVFSQTLALPKHSRTARMK